LSSAAATSLLRLGHYSRRHPLTWLLGTAYGFEWVSAEEQLYSQAFKERWAQGQGLITLEHDLLPWGLGGLERCPRDWCTRPYYSSGGIGMFHGLGLSKFSVALTRAYPQITDYEGWRDLDSFVAQSLQAKGYVVHCHWPTLDLRHRWRDWL
jgi:hypothetical protein